MHRLVTAAVVAALFACASPSEASTSAPYPGVVHKSETANGQRWHVVSIELGKPGLSLHVSREEQRGKTLSAIAKAEGAVVAVNGNIFRPSFSLCGIAVARSVPWKSVDDASCAHGLAWGARPQTFQLLSTKGLAQGALPEGVTDVVSGYPTLVREGVACGGTACPFPPQVPAAFAGPNPRTMLGFDAARTHAFLVVVDGRETGNAAGMTLAEAATFMHDVVGASDAINLDGGGSSELFVAAEGGVVNAPSDGSERVIADAVFVRWEPTNAAAAPSALPVDPPTFDERSRPNRARSAAVPAMAIAFAVAAFLMWIYGKVRR